MERGGATDRSCRLRKRAAENEICADERARPLIRLGVALFYTARQTLVLSHVPAVCYTVVSFVGSLSSYLFAINKRWKQPKKL